MRITAFKNFKFVLGSVCLLAVIFLALFGQMLTPHSPNQQDLFNSLQPPSVVAGGNIFGTDHLGRDIFARMASGARVSLIIAVSVVVISGVFGMIYGALSGYWGGMRDIAMQKVVETFWAFPAILLALTILAFFGQTLVNLIIAISIQRWIPYSRIARGQALVLRNREFVFASQVLGGGTAWIIRRHIMPNLYSAAIVVGTFSMATAILTEAALSFLGVGVPPRIATWGGMLSEGQSYVFEAWWIATFPGLGIFITVMSLNLIGDWLRDQLDPKGYLNLR